MAAKDLGGGGAMHALPTATCGATFTTPSASAVSTHDVGGIVEKDFTMAEEISKLYEGS
jgi:hypothetical protein